MTGHIKKTLASVLLAVIVFHSVFLSTLLSLPERANAQLLNCINRTIPAVPAGLYVPVFDTPNSVVQTTTETSVNNVSDKECILDVIVKLIIRFVITKIFDAIIAWAANGFEGGPTFITDQGNFFWLIADEEMDRFIDGSALGWLCDPFRIDVQNGFRNRVHRSRVPPRCTLSGVVGNIENFVGGDFRDGGWTAWVSMTSNPQNNPYGAYEISRQQALLNISGRQSNEQNRLNWGRGFHSLYSEVTGLTQTPGTVVENQIEKAIGQDIDYLNISREFDDLLYQLANVLFTKVMDNIFGQE